MKNDIYTKTLKTSRKFELVITKEFKVTEDFLWNALTDNDVLMRWNCPNNFEMIFSESDLKIGGKWRSGMRTSEGTDLYSSGEFMEIKSPNRLVFTHSWEDKNG